MPKQEAFGYVRRASRKDGLERWYLDLQPHRCVYSKDGNSFKTQSQAQKALDEVRALMAQGMSVTVILNRYFRKMRNLKADLSPKAVPWKEEYKLRMWSGAQRRAIKRQIAFNITPDDIVIPDICPVLGTPFRPTDPGHGRSDQAPSLDRLDPDLGYTKGNIVVISWRANKIKSNATVEELRRVASWMEYLDHCPPLMPE